jgi:hypothetical protein
MEQQATWDWEWYAVDHARMIRPADKQNASTPRTVQDRAAISMRAVALRLFNFFRVFHASRCIIASHSHRWRWRALERRSISIGQRQGTATKQIDGCIMHGGSKGEAQRGHASCYVPRHDLCLSACSPALQLLTVLPLHTHTTLSFLSLAKAADGSTAHCPLLLSLSAFSFVHPFEHLS